MRPLAGRSHKELLQAPRFCTQRPQDESPEKFVRLVYVGCKLAQRVIRRFYRDLVSGVYEESGQLT